MKNEQPWIIKKENGICLREVTMDLGMEGSAIRILQLTDIHFNAINDRDREENNELVINSYKDEVLWLKNGASVAKMQNCFASVGDFDQLVVTGDTLSYLSYGGLELMQKYLFEPYPNALICLGNHDPLRCWNARVDESETFSERLSRLQSYWIHDIFYTSKVLNQKIMLIQLENATQIDYGKGGFWDCQVEPFAKDLALARENGYFVLLFYHVPIATGDPQFRETAPYGKHGAVENYCDGSKHVIACEGGAASRIRALIEEYSDVIKGAFCGHMHGDYYTEIAVTDSNGQKGHIPQYIVSATPFDGGSCLILTIQ